MAAWDWPIAQLFLLRSTLPDKYGKFSLDFESDGRLDIYWNGQLFKTNSWTFTNNGDKLEFSSVVDSHFLGEIVVLDYKKMVLSSKGVLEDGHVR